MQIGSRLTVIRKRYGYTQKELASKLHLSQQVVSNIERGTTTPDVNFLQAAADLYQISMDDLIGREINRDNIDSIEKQIMSIVEKMDDTGKELSLGLVNQVAQHREKKDDE